MTRRGRCARAVLLTTLVLAGNTAARPQDADSSALAGVSGTWQGRLEALVVDNFQTGTSRTRWFLRTSRETLELGAAGNTALRAGRTVDVRGRLSGKRLAVTGVSTVSTSTTDSGAESCTAFGEQKIAV